MFVATLFCRSVEAETRWQLTVQSCRNWMRWAPVLADLTPALGVPDPFGVPSSRFDKGAASTAESPIGPYRIAMREAQMFWAAKHLTPMFSDAAFAARTHRDTGSVLGVLLRTHKSEWLRWRYDYPLHPLKALLAVAAVEMATIVESP